MRKELAQLHQKNGQIRKACEAKREALKGLRETIEVARERIRLQAEWLKQLEQQSEINQQQISRSQVWTEIERSLDCAATAKKAIEIACRLRAESERLCQKSAALLLSSPGFRKELRQRNRLKALSVLAKKPESPQLNFVITLQLNEPTDNPRDI